MSYRDVNKSFGVDSNDSMVDDTNAINESLDNLFSTRRLERLFNRPLGTEVQELLFELMNDLTADRILHAMIRAIDNYEPRIELILNQSYVIPDYDNNFYDVKISYSVMASGTKGEYINQLKTKGVL